MKAKKFLHLFVAVVLALLISVPANAAYGTMSTKITASSCNIPVVRVTVPATGKVYINPQKLPIKLSSGFQFEEDSDVPQIVSAPSYICNESEVPLEVNVSITGAVGSGSGITLVKSSTAASTSKNKNMFMFFQMKAVDESAVESLEDIVWDTVYNEDSHVLVSTTTKSKKQIVTLDANKEDNCYGAFRLYGDCIASPTKPWKTTDKLDVTVAFTFTPLPLE